MFLALPAGTPVIANVWHDSCDRNLHNVVMLAASYNFALGVFRSWVNYFAVGHSSRCFSFVKDWVDKKMRRHLMRARQRSGFGWNRWSRQWLYEKLGLFNQYQLRRLEPLSKAHPTGSVS
jgi:Group II intron, maturase-specific domain